MMSADSSKKNIDLSKYSQATFAEGCFWCTEYVFESVKGVQEAISGYAGGKKKNPTYEEVSAGITGHAEVLQVVYDPKKLSYEKLMDVYWRNVDPTVKDRQFCDAGTQYRTAVFYHSPEQKRIADESRSKLEKTKPFKAPIVTPVQAAVDFWPAEEYHQDYYKKNPVRYKFYSTSCGRAARLEELWGKPVK